MALNIFVVHGGIVFKLYMMGCQLSYKEFNINPIQSGGKV